MYVTDKSKESYSHFATWNEYSVTGIKNHIEFAFIQSPFGFTHISQTEHEISLYAQPERYVQLSGQTRDGNHIKGQIIKWIRILYHSSFSKASEKILSYGDAGDVHDDKHVIMCPSTKILKIAPFHYPISLSEIP